MYKEKKTFTLPATTKLDFTKQKSTELKLQRGISGVLKNFFSNFQV